MKGTELPPGVYTVVIDRVRKVRGKPIKRIVMKVVDGPVELLENVTVKALLHE